MSGSSALSKTLSNLDQFRVVSRDLTRGTLTGGVFTAVAYALLVLLLIAELGAFLRTTYQTNIVMDPNEESLMQINFDILMLDLPCKFLKLHVWDKFGEERIEQGEQFHYIPVDRTGQNKGMAYTKEEISVLEQVDVQTDVSEAEKKALDSDWSSTSDNFKHSDFQAAVTFHDFTLVNFFAEWCVHCRKFSIVWNDAASKISDKMKFTDGNGHEATVKMLKMNCVDFGDKCQQAGIPAFPTLRLYKRDGSFEVFQNKRTMDNVISFLTTSIRNSHLIVAKHHAMFNEGCQVQGTLRVPRVPGHFLLQAEAFGDVNVNPALTNVSHRVNHLSFGEKDAKKFAERSNIPAEMITHITPLDGKNFIVDRFHEAPQHYLKVVSTHVQGKSAVFYQMTHTDRVRRLRKENTEGAPQARFTYDFSPMSVVVKPKSKRWYEFLTSLFAILGGTYTIVELTSGAVDTVSTAVKDAMGKNN
mmetsp:Transcript_84860/g.216139  ORF Transcript_84860/g.216139 Transcript_84860/m.216139 type:complete len:472 (-) Transcript_84860:67-1482(-)|eukprot:CAMPEP_0183391428 /NCGR_PEP_ID=MMETSP0370-20130417/6415_1 /TAXON_ID=268820 /ORGANISM="Peridinium aciculiferum, Strain PAER-2" /LENGTH=471 /DNA_ID=CAMNT_0025571139 /DNA_START=121 /DNA_END=1536 /DNA_ORIENTATION=+